jgi:hypothetical protein
VILRGVACLLIAAFVAACGTGPREERLRFWLMGREAR